MKIKSIFLIEKQKPTNMTILMLLILEKIYNVFIPFLSGFYFYKYKSLFFLVFFFMVLMMPIRVDLNEGKIKIIMVG